jgi:hypothetical protein
MNKSTIVYSCEKKYRSDVLIFSKFSKPEGTVKNGHSRDTGKTGHKTHSEDKENKTYTETNK